MKKKHHPKGVATRAALAGCIVLMSASFPITALAVGPGETPGGAESSSGPGAVAGGGDGPAVSGGPGAGGGQETAGVSGGSSDTTWEYSGGAYRMPDGSAITNVVARGIDVSRWQGEINWAQVAADDVSFVMLGTRSRGAVDPYFHQNIQAAHEAGVKVGVYIYSLATTPEMAVAEADFVLDLIKDYPVSYPVAFDMEDDTQGLLSKEQLAQIANAFCQRISDAGYYPIIYANEYWLNNKLDMSLMDYPVWVARYSARPTYPNPVMWQATSTGSVNGIAGNVDIDFQFRDFSGVIPSDTWRTIGGNTYYYKNYAMQKDAWINDGEGWYYMGSDGLAETGWLTEGGELYYLNESTGQMEYGWKERDGAWYYLGDSGAADKGWVDDGGIWYFTDESTGIMKTGWIEDRGNRYFLEADGHMATGWKQQEGRWYYLSGSGALAKGWIDDGGTWYYSDAQGVMQTGWITVGQSRYFLRGDGSMATGWREMDGSWYYFNSQGQMVTNWANVDGQWYFFDGEGRMQTGLVNVNGVNYYLEPAEGHMYANTQVTVDGVVYNADASGALSLAAGQGEAGEQPGETGGQPAAPDGQNQPDAVTESPSVPPGIVEGVDGGPGVSG